MPPNLRRQAKVSARRVQRQIKLVLIWLCRAAVFGLIVQILGTCVTKILDKINGKPSNVMKKVQNNIGKPFGDGKNGECGARNRDRSDENMGSFFCHKDSETENCGRKHVKYKKID